jgi:hypothetical protein
MIGFIDYSLQSLVNTIAHNIRLPRNRSILSGSILVSLYSDLNYDWDFMLFWTASYIAYQYPRKCSLITHIHGNPACWSLVSMEMCSLTIWFPRIHLYGNVFVTRSLAMGLHVTIFRRIDPLLSGDSVNSGRCYVTPATYTNATIKQRGYATRFKATDR